MNNMITEERRAYLKAYYQANKERARELQREWQASNKDYYNELQRKSYKANKESRSVRNKVRNKVYSEANPNWYKNWLEANPGYHSKYKKERKAIDPAYRLVCNLRVRQRLVLKGKQSTTKGLGCDSLFLKEYIEKQFVEGMSWDNYGNKEGQWSVDHIKPLSLYYNNPELLPELIHYTNLQPMWHIDNLKKSKS